MMVWGFGGLEIDANIGYPRTCMTLVITDKKTDRVLFEGRPFSSGTTYRVLFLLLFLPAESSMGVE